MFTQKIKKLKLFFILIVIISCTHEDEFKEVPIHFNEPELEGTIISIDALLGILGQEIESNGEHANVVFEKTDNIIEGYVISSDKAGNFYKKIVIQDKNNNPSYGIQILVDHASLYTLYGLGRKIYVKLDGLSLGMQNGVPTLGISEGNTISAIPSFVAKDILMRSTEIAEIKPLLVTIEDFTDRLLNLCIKIDDIQFTKHLVLEDNTFTFAAEANDNYNGERIVESCTSGRTAIMSTSTFSDFKGLKLPGGKGSFEGILTKNYSGKRYNLVVNDPTGLSFDEESRCDPEVLECPLISDGNSVLFEEDFTNVKIKDLEDAGWINKNNSGGKLLYKTGSFGENQYIQITGYRSKESLYEVWLITPEIDLNHTENETLYFDLQAGYDNGNIMEIFVTNSYTGDLSSTVWTKLDVTIPRGAINAFGQTIASGPVSLSCIEGKVRIGYRYIGGDPRATTRYHIDNIKVIGR